MWNRPAKSCDPTGLSFDYSALRYKICRLQPTSCGNS
nr:MAG TPA: hypothetical protein [Caudoviricetes sp.]DAZ14757.1 MAG TPA: hypothetical protein [Caudoviricetes sp.]